MYDREMAQRALERTSPQCRKMIHEVARERGIPACDVALETALTVTHEQVGEALYALKKQRDHPALRSV